MQNISIYRRRIRQFIDRIAADRYGATHPLGVTYTYEADRQIPQDELDSREWKPIEPGTSWGELWASAWFRVVGEVPKEFAGKEVVALIDLGGEGCIFKDGAPYQGLTDSPRTGGPHTHGKRRVILHSKAAGGEKVDLLIEAAANALFGYAGHREFVFDRADVAVFNRDLWQLGLDLDFLYQAADALPEDSVRARRLWDGLNRAANAWRDGAGADDVASVVAELFASKANASATTVWSVGHAHLDLGWLWPVRETRRKAGRTFSTALRHIEEYPEYVFGASQPQALAWVKHDYPKLFAEIKKAVAAGRWENQGAMWVEPDMNITSGESLVRQLVHGTRFFRDEFGDEVKNLWLPDVFGYSAALPQILRLAEVEVFMTQKISWNEMNTFPHHTFDWEGIDGTRIRTHFLPTNTYNATNAPKEMIEGEKRFAQADVSNDWLNLYGIGDGGGGPSRYHIEFALRGRDFEGVPRMKLAHAREFFDLIAKFPADRLPVWRGELYLELHRGTYTTQGQMKRHNRLLELTLRDVEYLSEMAGLDQRDQVDPIWKETLLHQFHDILPGSSIRLVYEDAADASERNLATLAGLASASMDAIHGVAPARPTSFALHNTLSWARSEVACLPYDGSEAPAVSADGRSLPTQKVADGVLVPVTIPSMGTTGVTFGGAVGSASAIAGTPAKGRWAKETTDPVTAEETFLENAVVRVRLAADGTIESIFDKVARREVLKSGANRLLLWEDYPYSWDAWDISHYYRETTPEQAKLTGRRLVEAGPLRAVVEQDLTVGSSKIRQRIVLEAESAMVRIENVVDWSENRKQLRVQAAPAIESLEATYEIQFGTVKRPAHANTSWDVAQFEVAGQRFADYAQPDYGLGLVNDGKYGHYIRDGIMELTLLRSPKEPDPMADIGEHRFVYGYYPHVGTWEASDLLERSHELNSPVLVRSVEKPVTAPISNFAVAGEAGCCCGPSGGTVKIETIKRAEDGEGTIVRLYETRGTSKSIVLRTKRPIRDVSEVNLLERDPRPLSPAASGEEGFASEVHLDFGRFQIRTLRIHFA